MLGLKIFVWVQTFWQRPFAQLLPPCVMYFLLLKCVFLHFPIVFVVFQIYVWCTFNMYFLFYQYVFVVFPTIFAFPLYLHLFCCSFKIYFTFSTWFFVFTISICVYFVFFLHILYVFVQLPKEFERNCRGAEAASHLSLQKSLIPTMVVSKELFSQERILFAIANHANTSWLQQSLIFKHEQE